MSYRIPINIGLDILASPNVKLYLQVDGAANNAGNAMGVLGLTYSTSTFSNWQLVFASAEGQVAAINLNAQ